MRQKDRKVRLRKNRPRCPAEDHFPDTQVPICSHHKQISTRFLAEPPEGLPGILAVADGNILGSCPNPVGRKVADEFARIG